MPAYFDYFHRNEPIRRIGDYKSWEFFRGGEVDFVFAPRDPNRCRANVHVFGDALDRIAFRFYGSALRFVATPEIGVHTLRKTQPFLRRLEPREQVTSTTITVEGERIRDFTSGIFLLRLYYESF